MYAVIQTGGKQLKVAEGDVVRIERVGKESLGKGDELTLTDVLAIGESRVEGGSEGDTALRLGKPLVEGAAVKALVVREVRSPKVLVYKKKRRKGHQKFHGHRQDLVEVRIQSIQA